jgi:hypothetical protein
MVRETVDQYRKISADLNRPGSTPLHMPSVRFHRGANLVVVIGEPEAVAVAARVIGALPRVQRSVASGLPENYSNPFRQDAADALNVRIFPLKYASPAEVRASLLPLLSPRSTAAIAGNSLLVSAAAQELARVEKLIQQLDVPDTRPAGETSPPLKSPRR